MSLNNFEELLKRYIEGKCTPEEQAWLDQWLKNSNVDLDDEWSLWSHEQRKDFVDQLYYDIQSSTKGEPKVRELTSNKLAWAAVAACLIITSTFYYFIQRNNENNTTAEMQWSQIRVEIGKQKKVILSDSTAIWLQGGTTLRYPTRFAADKREVQLDGEALFEVMPDSMKPFTVRSGELETKVLGTTFNIEAYDGLDRKVVSLLEGKVSLRIIDKSGLQKGKALVLSPQEAAIFNSDDRLLTKNTLPVFESADAFKRGILQFEESTVDEVLFKLGVAYDVTINYNKQKANQKRITATFSKDEPIDDVFKSIARSMGATYTRKNNVITFRF